MFASREDAGRRLGRHLIERGVRADLVLGLPRGGVVVAAETACLLKRPLGVLIVRKIGHPFHREFAVGAMAERDVILLDERAIGHNPAIRAELAGVLDEERKRFQEYEEKFHRNGAPELTGKNLLLVDDGLATGATTEAAALSARKQGAAAIIVAAPVASTSGVERLRHVADQVVVLMVDADFDAVGRYYDVFGQTTDEEVLRLLGKA
jgi:putative phosphoribosyl transferase